uniref:Uncharacterized protein n=1 Tax=Cyprinus carpio TaxID=7962 RepID=A0A8C1SJ97_CYPCA
MASVKIVYVEDLNCPVCFEIFKTPVLLSCSHIICKECLQQFWKNRNTQDCPICRRTSSRDEPLCNLVLKNLCESITAESASGSEEVCSLHNEKLKLFCLDDKQPVCIVCRDSEKHASHRFSPIDEVPKRIHVTPLFINLHWLPIAARIKFKALMFAYKTTTGSQIKEEFTKLHQFLQDEEEASITALRKEEEQKSQMMKEKLEEMNRQISDLSDTIKDIEEKMNTSSMSFLNVRTVFFLYSKQLNLPAQSNCHPVLGISFNTIIYRTFCAMEIFHRYQKFFMETLMPINNFYECVNHKINPKEGNSFLLQ